MLQSNPVLVPATEDQPQIVRLGTVAAQNLALALNLGEEHVPKIERAIADEINSMSAHFSLAFRDIQDQYEIDIAKTKSAFSWAKQNTPKLVAAASLVLTVGVVIGFVVGKLS